MSMINLNNGSRLERATSNSSSSVFFPVSAAVPMPSSRTESFNASFTSSANEDSDKESAALALSALAGTKRTHSPTSVADSSSLPPQTQSQSNAYVGISNNVATTTADIDTDTSTARNVTATITPYASAKRMKASYHMNQNTQQSQQIHHLAPVTVMTTAVATPHSQSRSPVASYNNINMHCPESANQHHHFAHMQQRMQYLDNAMPMPGSHYVSSPTVNVNSHTTPVPANIQSNRNCISDNIAAAAGATIVTTPDTFKVSPSHVHAHAQLVSAIPPNQQLLPDGSYKRKDKSLGVLCVNFMMRYNTIKLRNPHITPAISIDEASNYLAVERRRIYDIINILEAIHVVSRKCKNTYNWHGMEGVPDTFFELQKDAMVCFEEDAVRNGFKEMMEKKVEHELVVMEEEEKKEEPVMPLGLAMLLAGGECILCDGMPCNAMRGIIVNVNECWDVNVCTAITSHLMESFFVLSSH